MRKVFLLFLIIGASVSAQNFPLSYKLGAESVLNKSTANPSEAPNPKSNTILDIEIAGSTIWLGTSRGLSKSTDDGVNWVNYYGTDPFGTESIPAIGYYDGVIWAATAHSEEKDGNDFPFGTGLHYSSDEGETWTSVPQPLDKESDSTVIYGVNTIRALPITTAYNNIVYDIAFTPGTVWVTTFAGGLRKSADMGSTWRRVVLPPDYLNEIFPDSTYEFSLQPVAGNFGNENNLNHRLFSVIAFDNTIFAGSAGGINISTDGGSVWKKRCRQNQDNAISGNFVVGLGYNSFDNSVYAATWKAEGADEFYAVSRTNDLGQNWTVSLNGQKAHNFGFAESDEFVGTDDNIFRTSDGGSAWIGPTSIFDPVINAGIRFDFTDFYSAGSKINSNGDTDIYVGTTNGLTRMTESLPPWGGSWKIYIASETISDESETYAFPNPFSPRLESVRIKYFLRDAENVTIRIFDFGMNLVRTLIQNAPRQGNAEHFQSWDGKDEAGNLVSNGVYFYRVDNGGDPIFGKIMALK